ncbi:MAG: phytanoyl-CoA dioxygenase family protein [Planctomycetes bacterium]|nr:phytanoyl-CoA dioxygenase family protein [Planctomycetota bacterium]
MTAAPALSLSTDALRPEQLRRFHDDGILSLPAFFPADLAASLPQAWRDLLPVIARGDSGIARTNQFIHGVIPPPLGDLYKYPRLVALARQLLGNDLALYMNRLLIKDAGWSGHVGAHQDMVYFHGGLTKLSVFIPLTPMNPANGGLAFVAGSHKLGNLGERGVILLDQFPPMPVVTPDVAPGDVCLMDIMTWHLSEQANAPSDRIVIQIIYQPATDGSYYHGVSAPTLVHGQWRTDFFNSYGQGIWRHGEPKPKKSTP